MAKIIFAALTLVALLATDLPAQDATRSKVNFYARRDYPGMYTQWVAAADTDGDGIPDMIALANGSPYVLLGNGDGTFRSSIISTNLPLLALTFAAADLNGDKRVDLVLPGITVPGYQNGIAISLGNGDGTFQPETFYAIDDGGIEYIALGDFNNDGFVDIAATGEMGAWLLTGRGDGTFSAPVLAAPLSNLSTGSIAAADFNADGNLDLVIPTPGTGFVVLLGNGNGTFQSPLAFAHPISPYGVAAGVLVKGGFPGIVLTAPANSEDVYLYFGNGKGQFLGPEVVPLPGLSRFGDVAIADVNGDGYPDLVSGTVSIAYGTAIGKFHAPVNYTINDVSPTFNLALADLRNNGLLDILTDSQDSVSVLLNTGKGNYEDGLPFKISGGTGCGASADFNGDGRPDLAVNDLNPSGITILLGTGKAASPFTTGETIAASGIGCLVTGDVNGDGIPDLVAPADGNTVVTYLGNGDGTFTLRSTTSTPSGGYVALGDFNHDGKLDFVTSGNLLALGNGDGTFGTPQPYIPNPLSGGFSNLAVGDINNDGFPDVVLTNTDSPYQNLYVLLNNQHGGFTAVPTNFGESTTQAILTDLDGDGNLDLIASVGGGAQIYLGDGTGQFTFHINLGNPVYAPGFNMVADFNGDGILDIGVLGADTLAIFYGKGSATYSTAYCIGTGLAPTDLLPVNLHGQAPGAGLPDIVSTDANTGLVILLNESR